MTPRSSQDRPTFSLDEETLRANARAWRRHVGVPIAAVVKADGYAWGCERIIRAVENEVERFFVADMGEFETARRVTERPIALLGDVPPEFVGQVLDARGLPNVSTSEGLAAATAWAADRGRTARIRVGLRPAVLWYGFEEAALREFAPQLAESGCEVECWTHLPDPSCDGAQLAAFERAVAHLRTCGVRVVGTDVTSTFPAARLGSARGAFVRLGVGLFGARREGPREVRCALRVHARLIRSEPAQGQTLGYGNARAPMTGRLVVLRCGYGDGFPRIGNAPVGRLLFCGMQYTLAHAILTVDGSDNELVGAATDLDALASATSLAAHEIVVRLGMGASYLHDD
ncbi:MAG TPA: alanine racemase [Candidatus Baltobacteraceae bacterium]|nr:alanine racemase [Candidatus Baltobacteraceae bacterium]